MRKKNPEYPETEMHLTVSTKIDLFSQKQVNLFFKKMKEFSDFQRKECPWYPVHAQKDKK